ncbi:universal stress protein [Hoeflea prorocentri]|uniref:Universal stress protein n=1 Tax=Hoeflea prorocentri TaxID=1922333 RepID=A0A9X3UJ33_9HYPH|nr:universal stress protein [Hoeflea prorocentri]MCY6381594.1 universal stress protein [Hoeflea prorocentri]MDA5399394.1 universal stress protein [Hoeflea prorocentri]
MYQKILVPMALDHGISPQTLAVARTLAADTGQVTAMHVYEAPQGSVTAYLDAEAVNEGFEMARSKLAEKTKDLAGVETVLIKGHTYRTIIDYATEHGIDCIVIGSHKPGLGDYFLGSTAARVVRHAPCAVHVCRSSDA